MPAFVEINKFELYLFLFEKQNNSVLTISESFPSSEIMATFSVRRNLAAMARETQENPRNNQSQNSAAPRLTDD